MAFDEAMAKVGTYLKNNDLSNSDNNDRFFYIILNDLQKQYAPTVKMTKEQKRILKEYREPGLYDGDYAFNAFFDDTCAPRLNSMRDNNLYDNLTEFQLMQAWLHPETIKIVDE